MSVILQSATRVSPAPCNHFSVTVNVDGAHAVTFQINGTDLSTPITDEEVTAVLKLWARYRISRGQSLASLIGGTIFPEVG